MKTGIKLLLNPWLSLLTLSLVIALRVSDPSFVESVRLRYYDTLIAGQEKSISENVVIANIDDAALTKNGQWPFPRDTNAGIIEELYQHGAGLVVWNIIMSEPDRFNGDDTLVNTLKTYPVILSKTPSNIVNKPTPLLASKLESPVTKKIGCDNPVAGVSVIGDDINNWVIKYPTILSNLDLFESCSAGSGITNTLPEIDGVTRRLPMIVSSGDILYPNLALETLRVVAGDPSFQVKVGEAGIQAVRIPQFKTVTTDPISRIWLSWNTEFKSFSVTNIPDNLENKIVIVGLTANGLGNPVPTSIGSQYPHYLQGTVIDTLVTGNNISIPDWAFISELGATILLSIIAILFTRWKYGFIPIIAIVFGIHFCNLYIFSNYKFLLDSTIPILGIVLVYVHAYTCKYLTELKAKLQIKKQFGTYLSPALVEKLQKNPELLRLGGESKELTIYFSDIRSFTTLSEHYKTDPMGLTNLITRYMDKMLPIIMKNNGTVGKLIGDAIMCWWGAPIDVNKHASLALKTALEMEIALEELNNELIKEGKPPLHVGAGISTGNVFVGNMGSSERFSYDILGDEVNLAARLEGQTKSYGVSLIISQSTKTRVDLESL